LTCPRDATFMDSKHDIFTPQNMQNCSCNCKKTHDLQKLQKVLQQYTSATGTRGKTLHPSQERVPRGAHMVPPYFQDAESILQSTLPVGPFPPYSVSRAGLYQPPRMTAGQSMAKPKVRDDVALACTVLSPAAWARRKKAWRSSLNTPFGSFLRAIRVMKGLPFITQLKGRNPGGSMMAPTGVIHTHLSTPPQ
jgi:hypothetical protein